MEHTLDAFQQGYFPPTPALRSNIGEERFCVCVCSWREKPQKYEGLYKTAPPGIFKSQDSLYAQPPAITQHYQIVQPVATSIGFYLQYAALGYDSLYSSVSEDFRVLVCLVTSFLRWI